MSNQVKVCIGLYNSNPRKNRFKEIRGKMDDLPTPSEFSDWNWKTQEDQVWYEKNLPINPDNMNELAVALSKSILSMKKLAESADIEILTEDKEQ